MRRLMLVSLLTALILAGCAPGQQGRVEKAQEAVQVYKVQHYLERSNVEKRLRLFDDPALVSWIYCLAENGQIVFYGPVLGKVTSSSKRLEPERVDNDYCASFWNGDCVQELMGADMTYGSSDSYVFWFDPDGNYYQWGGNYFLTSIPIKVGEPVLNVRDVGGE